jgi:hypothetical protein
MSTKYLAQWLGNPYIKAVEIERETAEIVWINGRRCAKTTSWEWYRDTWEEAHAILLGIAQGKVNDLRRQLGYANDRLGNVKGMKPATAASAPEGQAKESEK